MSYSRLQQVSIWTPEYVTNHRGIAFLLSASKDHIISWSALSIPGHRPYTKQLWNILELNWKVLEQQPG